MISHRWIILLILLTSFVKEISAEDYWLKNPEEFWERESLTQAQRDRLLRKTAVDLKTSLIIPCHYKHAVNLAPLLSMYENQTRLPDEVVISISEAYLLGEGILEGLQNIRWAFPVTIVVSNSHKYAGENRNTACEIASGDLFIFQDADDIPHPQRVEIIHHLFSVFEIDHLMHEFIKIYPDMTAIAFAPLSNFESLYLANPKTFDPVWYSNRFTNGNIAYSRKVFEKVKWTDKPRQQDTEFNRKVYENFDTCMTLGATLYGYLQYLSIIYTPGGYAEKQIFMDYLGREKLYEPVVIVEVR